MHLWSEIWSAPSQAVTHMRINQICAQTRERKNDPKLHHTSQVIPDNVPQMCVMMYLLPITSVPGVGREADESELNLSCPWGQHRLAKAFNTCFGER